MGECKTKISGASKCKNAEQMVTPALSLSYAFLEVVCSSSQREPARSASTWWLPTGSSSSMPPGTRPTTSRVSSESTALANWRPSTSTGSLPRWAQWAVLFMDVVLIFKINHPWSANLNFCWRISVHVFDILWIWERPYLETVQWTVSDLS